MKRDFSESSRTELLQLIDQIDGVKKSNFTDWIGDGWYAFEEMIGMLDISNYLEDVNAYHRKVIDKNNTSKDTINNIFEKVKLIDKNYGQRLIAFESLLEQFITLVNQFSESILPNGNGVNIDDLIKKVKEYQDIEKAFLDIAVEELSAEEFEQLDKKSKGKIASGIFSVLLKVIPNMKVGQKIEIPLGKNTTFYYSIESKVKTSSGYDFEWLVDYQKGQISNSKIGIETDGDLSLEVLNSSNGEMKKLIKTNDFEKESGGDNALGIKSSFKNGNDTYTIKFEYSLNKVSVEESLKTEDEFGALTSTIGITTEIDNDWKPLPEPIRAPENVALPNISNEVDWESIAKVAIVIGAAVGVVLLCVFVPPAIPVVATGAVVMFA